MLSEVINYADDSIVANLTVEAATSVHEHTRVWLHNRADRISGLSPDLRLLFDFDYVNVASVVTGEYVVRIKSDNEENSSEVKTVIDRLHPLPFDAYCEFPFALFASIQEVVYRLNPGWVYKTQEQVATDTKKAVTNSTAD